MKRYVADFETSTIKWDTNKCWVWAYAFCEIGKGNEYIHFGNNIDAFISEVIENPGIYYFHNLKFDGSYILDFLENSNFEYVESKEDKAHRKYTCLISDMGQFFNITFWYNQNGKLKEYKFYDSFKILPFSVSKIAKDLKLEEQKLELDYDTVRTQYHKLTEHEKEYITNDIQIMNKALKGFFDKGLKQMTSASNALATFKKMLSEAKFEHYFPNLTEIDGELRQSYKGGYVYLNPDYANRKVGKGIVLDVNSLYPSRMRNCKMPWGIPKHYEGQYVHNKVYDLYIQKFACSFELKENKLPILQIKNTNRYQENEYLTTSNGRREILTMTNIDMELFFEHYNVDDLLYIEGWEFKSINGLFNKYVDFYTDTKIQAKKDNNYLMYIISKLQLNSLYGKFALNPKIRHKIPYLGLDGIVHFKTSAYEERKPIYLPVGSFITSYARKLTIETSQAIVDYSIKKYGKNLYIYSDTDSIHTLLPIEDAKKFCKIDDYELGAWKHESTFTEAIFLRQKTYIERIDGELKITCASMPKNCIRFNNKTKKYEYKIYSKDYISEFNIDDFKIGFSCGGKLTYKHLPGGVVLVETPFEIKEKTLKKASDMLLFNKDEKEG